MDRSTTTTININNVECWDRKSGSYAPNKDVVFPQMTHVCAVVLSATPAEDIFRRALQEAMAVHPLLNAHVEGDGEPEKRIDLMQMVGKGDPHPCTFVAETDKPFSVENVLTVYNNQDDVTQQWKDSFGRDLDEAGSLCNTESGPLWKLEWYRSSSLSANDKPCALVFSLNHAISNQSSLNRFVDQIVQNVASLEATGNISPSSKIYQDIPMSAEDSVLGLGQRFSDIGPRAFSLKTVSYILGKAGESFRNPVILPDKTEESDDMLGAMQIVFGKTAGGQVETSEDRQTTLQFRTLDAEGTSALLASCRENGVSISNALTAAMTLTATDFTGGDVGDSSLRNYKVLQSLDMRRFGHRLDKGETVACMAGSHDLMLGPVKDGSGKALSSDQQTTDKQFWELAKESRRQTERFVQSNGPAEAVRVFDFAMTISDMTNLVHLTSQSKDTTGRAYSAGVTNVGVYERQSAFARDNQEDGAKLQIEHGRYRIQDIFFATQM